MAEQIRLTGAQQTLLGPLHARALDSLRADPVLGDHAAHELAARIDFDFRRLRMDSADRMAVVLRAKEIDDRARDFLAAHPDAVVLHLACGLDSRPFRLEIPDEARWFDVDMPDVVELRDRLYPQLRDNHRTLAASVTETGWLDEVPPGRPTLVIAEGLTPYLSEQDGIALLRRLVERFGSGAMLFDVVAPWTVRAAKHSGFLRSTGARFHWGVGDPHDLEIKVPGLHLRGSVPVTALPGVAKVEPRDRRIAGAMNAVPPLRDAMRVLRFDFEREKRIPVDLTGPAATMLATLHLRALDNRSPEPVLADRWADAAVRRLDYDFTRLGLRANNAISVAIRAKALDEQVRAALRPGMAVLHLGCGLDSRFERVNPPADVQWYDVDQPAVIELREQLFASSPNRRALGRSVTDPGLLDEIPADRPVLVVAEGLTMYLTRQDGESLVRRIVDRFPSGQLLFDAFNTVSIHLNNVANPAVTRSGSRLHWGIDDPRGLEPLGLRLVSEISFLDAPELAGYPLPARLVFRAMSKIPTLNRLGRILHYRF
ncbi:class I SAM-dependent methyltransferase [Saccharopolyspora sp. TS4A08]|uniref:Class I SAM-dependent methyltransferase n=1 Tax=Saccharopolyspora ipomoeae TaxID=3042027 RepID=A0ABT6PLP2_9PSEU|nr:class I SAM-dependent methyltransferase [Saccharopolyspora sp. TS4A08]MDI2028921.1 class I SAM-dependent methyltransferase [Saccharopolyspora sp. TS4A08]